MATSKVCTQFRELWHQEDPEDQDDSEQVEADEAAAAKRLGLSTYWLKIELDPQVEDLEENEVALQVPQHEHHELKSSISLVSNS